MFPPTMAIGIAWLQGFAANANFCPKAILKYRYRCARNFPLIVQFFELLECPAQRWCQKIVCEWATTKEGGVFFVGCCQLS